MYKVCTNELRCLERDYHQARNALTQSQREYLDSDAMPSALLIDPAVIKAQNARKALNEYKRNIAA